VTDPTQKVDKVDVIESPRRNIVLVEQNKTADLKSKSYFTATNVMSVENDLAKS